MTACQAKKLEAGQPLDWMRNGQIAGRLMLVDVGLPELWLKWDDGTLTPHLPFTHKWWKQIELSA